MNWLYIIVMAYIVISALRGYHKGFLKVVYSLAALLITIVFVAFMTPAVSRMLRQCTPIYEQLEQGCEKYVRIQIKQQLDQGDMLYGIAGLPEDVFPKSLQGVLAEGSKEAIEKLLESEKIYQKAAETIAVFCLNFAAFFISLVIIQVILFIINRKVDVISQLPGIHLANMILGFFAGIVKAFIVIWSVFLLVRITAVLPMSAALIEMIDDNAVLKSLYEQNKLIEIMQYVSSFIK